MTSAASAPDAIEALLRGDWTDPDGGPPIGVPMRAVAILSSLRGVEAELVAPLRLGRRLAVVSDSTTQRVLGERVERSLAALSTIVPVVLEGRPHADAETVATLRRATLSADALVAVGSGTINDLCKFVAATDGKPYVVFATAPSMNGYTSMNAAITVDGHKKSLPAAVPQGVFMDLEVLAAAPHRMIRAGLGDSVCRSTAQADWLLAHHLVGTPYRRAPFVLLADDEPALLNEPEALLRGDLDAMRVLARTLVLSGFGMTLCGGSYPASQGEHLISHYIDMFAPTGRADYFHGEQIAVATLTMARIQEALLAAGPPQLQPATITCTELQRRFGSEIGESCWREFEAKRLTVDTATDQSQRVADRWDNLLGDLRATMLPASTVAGVLGRVGGPATPADIGLSSDFYATAVRNARFLRNRYTFLDLADDSGWLGRGMRVT